MSYPKLRGAIREKFGTQGTFAKALGIDQSGLSKRLAGKQEWSWAEVQATCELLEIPMDRVGEYFFTN